MTTGRRIAWAALAAAILIAGSLPVLSGCGGGHKAPVVVLGVDGADFDLLMPWLEAGELPHLKAFLDGAAVGELTTVFPILSPVCWTSAATGVNPGKHGIFDFQKFDADGETLLIETATHRRATPVWMLLSEAGYRVGVMNVPMTYPPDPVRGDMISGFPFPQGEISFTYPPELQEGLGDYRLDQLGLSLFKTPEDEMLAEILTAQEQRGEVAEQWAASGDYDFLWLTFTGTDKVQHFFWKHMDEEHPRHEREQEALYQDAILDLWRRQDAILGRILAALPADATVLMMSDHGFDAVHRQVNMKNWIAQTDFSEWLAEHATPEMDITNGILHYAVEGMQPGSADREALIDKFEELAGGLRDPQTGVNPFESIFRREEIYHGRLLEKAPDVIFHEAPKYFVTRGVPDSADIPVFQDVWTTSFSAHHRPEGVVAVSGPGVRRRTEGSLRDRLGAGGDFDGARILDVAPTVLAFMAQPVPDQMDGRALAEAFTPEFLSDQPVRVEPVEGFLLDRPPPSELSEKDKEAFKAIPYIQ